MYDRQDSLFCGTYAHDYFTSLQQGIMEQLKRTPENTILNTPTDDLVAGAVDQATPDFPILHDDDTTITEAEEEFEVRRGRDYDFYHDTRGGSRTYKRHIISFHVPVSGNTSLLQLQPSSRVLPGPRAQIARGELVIKVESHQKTQEQIKQEFTTRVDEIRRHIETLKNDLRGLPTQIEHASRGYIEQRKAELLKKNSLISSLGFPMKRRDGAPTTYRAPEVRRKITPVRQPATAKFKPEPVLEEAEYQHILNVMDNMTKVMERSPHAFKTMGEEDIRQHFLMQLNSQYEGQATGETFNFQGKTDILIRSDGKNIFIAECKFWKGEKVFLETVNQLLGYLGWRDSKAAVVVFNRNKNLTGVLDAIKAGMEKHAHKKRGPKIEGETRLRYVMGNPTDHNREIILTVMVYDIPTA